MMPRALTSLCLLPLLAFGQWALDFDEDFAAAAEFTPLSLPSCGLWLDSSRIDTITLSGTNLIAWADLSGFGRNATNSNASTAPVWSANAASGRPAVIFVRSAIDIFLTASININAKHTIFSVFSCDDNARGYMCPVSYLYGYSADRGAPFYVRSEDRKSASYPLFNSGNWDGNGTATYALSELFVFSFVMNETGGLFFGNKNGVRDASQTSSASNTAAGLTFGKSNLPSQQWCGKIQEFIFYERILSTSEIKLVERYLGAKWGIAITQ